MANDADAIDAEQRGAAECTVMEAAKQPRHSRESPVALRVQNPDDVLLHQAHHEVEDALAQLQDDVAGEAVGDDHVGGAAVDVAALDVTDETVLERTGAEKFERLLNEIVTLTSFLT